MGSDAAKESAGVETDASVDVATGMPTAVQSGKCKADVLEDKGSDSERNKRVLVH